MSHTTGITHARRGDIAALYSRAGNQYLAYADGDPERVFCFEGLYADADRQHWSLLETKLDDLRATGLAPSAFSTPVAGQVLGYAVS